MEYESKGLILFIAGPTASGKSEAAVDIARIVDGEIVNADAMQVYRDLRILTARPSEAELKKVPHHLYGTMDGSFRCSAGRWARLASKTVRDIQARNKVPVITGGTGLYFKALEEGLSPIPEVPEEIRAAGKALFDRIGPEPFRALVISADPAMERLPASDQQRLIRAWEVYKLTGLPLSHYQALPREPLVTGSIHKCVIVPDRGLLYDNCDRRFDEMINEGALEEVATLLERDLDSSLPVMKSLGVPELIEASAGRISMGEAIEQAKRNTRRFAKRQMTWFRGQAGDWPQVPSSSDAVDLLVKSCSTVAAKAP